VRDAAQRPAARGQYPDLLVARTCARESALLVLGCHSRTLAQPAHLSQLLHPGRRLTCTAFKA